MIQVEIMSSEQDSSQMDENTSYDVPSPAQSQLSSLLSCLTVLSELAAMESDEYQSEILKSPKASRRDLKKFPLGESLAQLERSHGLNNTPIASLTQSIHRFQSSLAILHDESDAHAAEVNSLQEFIKSLQQRNEELENDMQTLKDRNKKLAMKLERTSEEKRCLASFMKKYIRKAKASQDQEKELEELKVAYQLQAHENILIQANRNRTTSLDSNLSDGLDFVHSEEGSGDELSSFSFGGSSLVTDGGVATLCLQTNRSASPRSDDSQSSFDSFPLTTPTARNQTLTLNFPRGCKLGVKILELPDDNNMSTPTAKPNAELTRAMLTTEADDTRVSEVISNQNHFGLPFHINIFNNKMEKEGRHHRQDSGRASIFVISGYNDFDETLNAKPPLGSRIIAINNVAVPDGYTMDQLLHSLKASSAPELVDNADGSRLTYSVTFRTDILTMRQHEILQKALKQDEKERQRDERLVEKSKNQLNENKSDVKLGKFNFKFKGRGKGNPPDEVGVSKNKEGVASENPEQMVEMDSETRRQDNNTFANAANALQFWKPKNQESESVTTDLAVEDPLI